MSEIKSIDECLETCENITGEIGFDIINESIIIHLKNFQRLSSQVEPSVIPKIADRDKKLLTHFLESLRDYERESHSLLGFDERVNEEFVSIYLQNQFSNFTI